MPRLITLILLSILSIYGCANRTETISNSEKQTQDSLQRVNWDKLSEIASMTGYVAGLDTMHFKFSFQFQNFLKNNNNILLHNFRLQDIEILDSTYLISIYTRGVPRLFFDLKCTEIQLKQLFPEVFNSNSSFRPYIISTKIGAKIKSVKKVMLKINTIENSNNEPDLNLSLDPSGNFIFEGELIYIDTER